MWFPQKRNTTAKGPKWVGRQQQTWHKGMVVNLSASNVSDETFLCKLYMEPFGKNYQADTDALNKNVVQYRGECEWNVSEINITKVVSTKWYHLGITAIFLQKPRFI